MSEEVLAENGHSTEVVSFGEKILKSNFFSFLRFGNTAILQLVYVILVARQENTAFQKMAKSE